MKINFLKTSYGVVEVELLCNFASPTEQKSKGEHRDSVIDLRAFAIAP